MEELVLKVSELLLHIGWEGVILCVHLQVSGSLLYSLLDFVLNLSLLLLVIFILHLLILSLGSTFLLSLVVSLVTFFAFVC
jgi:hypothetical protein